MVFIVIHRPRPKNLEKSMILHKNLWKNVFRVWFYKRTREKMCLGCDHENMHLGCDNFDQWLKLV